MTGRPDPRDRDPNTLAELLGGERLRALVRSEPGLWPLVAVLGIVAVTLAATLLIMALRSHSVVASAAVALLALMTALAADGERRRRGRFGPMLWTALLFWAISGGVAYAVVGWGLG